MCRRQKFSAKLIFFSKLDKTDFLFNIFFPNMCYVFSVMCPMLGLGGVAQILPSWSLHLNS